jgi:hypothetical protein
VAAGVSGGDVEALHATLVSSPVLFPLDVNPAGDAVLFVSLTEDDYREASFLDRRILRPESRTGVVPRGLMRPWLAPLPRNCDFIFHVSHAGSTLLSRLLGCHDRVFSLREPAVLRSLAGATDTMAEGLLDDVLACMQCRIVARHPAGDHVIMVGQVEQADAFEGKPLLYYRGGYATLER